MCDCSPCPATIIQYEEPTEYVNIDIHAFPLPPPPPPPPKPGVPPHLLKILEKYPYNWRLDQLSKQVPRKQRSKFTGPPKPSRPKVPILIPEIQFFADHLSRPPLRTVILNKKQFGPKITKKRRKYFNNIIKKTWNSIYNYYKKKARDKRNRALAGKKSLGTKKSEKTMDTKRLESLAQPKKLFLPPKKESKKKKKTWKECPDCADHLDTLAAPKARKEVPTRELGYVNPAALTYTPTETILKLSRQFDRYNKILPPLELGKVNKSALRYKITPRIEALAVPKKRSEKEVEDSEWDPWAISKNALKYKPTPRILELAKPTERD
ncbi:uncharacterized protein LOC130900982 [Diorhabda carinulata]|uniref:uncharacterized protein LOC130900982 n=1 Tax=Diorhabda carinulata TaxID=1163345 RepID=UPI0025A12E5F|nr:uncharacterized protein LOC130900982 [Diorhabda carinulata]